MESAGRKKTRGGERRKIRKPSRREHVRLLDAKNSSGVGLMNI